MHFLQNLLNYMLPIQIGLTNQSHEPPPGFDHVIVNTGEYVVTSTNADVIATA